MKPTKDDMPLQLSLHSNPKLTASNLEEYRSHYHCWEVENPSCGLKGPHRCCLCEKPLPEALECTCASFFTVRGVHKPDCPAFEAPENKPLLSSKGELDMDGLKDLFEAPTDEGWVRQMQAESWYIPLNQHTSSAIREFIASLLQKEREKAFDAGGKTVGGTGRTMYEAGKSEAFNLVRQLILEAKDLRDPHTQNEKIINGHQLMCKVHDFLPILEGK